MMRAGIAANKIPGVRAGLIHDVFPAHPGVEDDDMNVFSLGGKVIGSALAWELIEEGGITKPVGKSGTCCRLPRIGGERNDPTEASL